MTDNKAEWERLLDDSFQWHVAHHLATALIVCIFIMALAMWDLSVLLCQWIAAPLYFGCVWKENSMIRKSQELRKEQP